MYITEITDQHVGKKISCIIDQDTIKEGEISKEGSYYYILQNIKNGATAKHKKDYKYSWGIFEGRDVKSFNISQLKLLNQSNIYELW